MSKAVISGSIRAVKSARKLMATRDPITLTPAAVERITQLISQEPGMAGLRVGVKQRGCNGLSYTLEYAKEKKKFDVSVEVKSSDCKNIVKIFVDAKAQMSLLGTEMDYVRDELSSEFVFNNPNIKGTCGCGESFQV